MSLKSSLLEQLEKEELDFPDEMPEHIKKEIKEKLAEVKKFAKEWHERIHDLSDTEFVGLNMAIEVEKLRRMAEAVAENPIVREAVLRKERGRANTVTDLPDIIPMGAPSERIN